jgi:tetratricopeptide (TPR) repeat protein
VDGTSGAEIRRGGFEHSAGDPLVIRDSLAQQVALFLREWLGDEVRLREERAGTRNPAAWTVVQRAAKLYKDAEVLVRTDLPGAAALYDRGDSLLAQAETLDDRWLVPIVERGKLAYRRAQLERVAAEADPWLRTALGHAERVLAREARNPDALELRGVIRFRQSRLEPDPQQKERLRAQAEADLEAATVLNSIQVGAWNVLSILRYDKRDLVGANLAARRAYEVDAYLAQADQVLARLYVTAYDLEQFQQAADWCEKGRARFPQNLALAECELVLMTTPVRRPDPDRAWQLAGEIPSLAPAPRRDFYRFKEQIVAAAVLARAGLADSARRVLERSRGDARIDEERELLGFQAWVYTTLGDRERALELLREYFVASPDHRRGFAKHVHWWWRPLQDDARFRALIAG